MSALFEQLLGDAFATLAPCVRKLHRDAGTRRYRGDVEVERSRHPLARLCAFATRLPPAGRRPIEVEISADADGEIWTRHVAGRAMRSRLWSDDGLLREKLGVATFAFRLATRDGGIDWQLERVGVLGLPLPARAFAGVGAREGESDGRYTFDVRAALPSGALIVRYRGWLALG